MLLSADAFVALDEDKRVSIERVGLNMCGRFFTVHLIPTPDPTYVSVRVCSEQNLPPHRIVNTWPPYTPHDHVPH
jgi:hypothetical protein